MIINKKNVLIFVIFTIIQPYFTKTTDTNIVKIEPFKKSMEKDFEEAVAYYVNRKSKNETAEDVKHDIKSGSKLLNYPDFIRSLPEIYDWAHSNGLQDFRDIQNTFNKLKILMGIPPDEVEIKFAYGPAITNGAIMGYNPLDRTVYIYPIAIDDHCRSFQLFTLIHELTHAQQHIRFGLLENHLCSNKKKENEADLQAANAIQCHMCMQAIKADYLLHEATSSPKEIMELEQHGYLTGETITMITNTKQEKNICDFHLHFGKTNELLYDRWLKSQRNSSLMDRFNFDKTNGSLEERLSTVDFRQND